MYFPVNYPYYVVTPVYPYRVEPVYPSFQANGRPNFRQSSANRRKIELKDYGKEPYVVNIEKAAEQNRNFRATLWTGEHLQIVVMNINVGEDIGLEVHPDTDQFLRIEEGQGIVRMGDSKEHLDFSARISEDDAIVVPAGKWHNIINTRNRPLKLYNLRSA